MRRWAWALSLSLRLIRSRDVNREKLNCDQLNTRIFSFLWSQNYMLTFVVMMVGAVYRLRSVMIGW